MKTLTNILGLMLALFITSFSFGQSKISTTAINTSIEGTSTLHDWEMKGTKADCEVMATFDQKGNLSGITSMKFKVGAKTLKSGKGAMDKNAYKALKADKFANITADLKSAKVTTKDNVNYTVNAVVILNIAGKAKETDVTASFKKINVDSYSVNVKKSLVMSEYGVEPPSFMMGTVTTGDKVDLSFSFILNK
jgi:hypothetical protein